MRTRELLQEIRGVFPPAEKPRGLSLSFHPVGCFHCEYLREYLEPFTAGELPEEALRSLCNELSCLSGAGWRWMLPSYLNHCVSKTTSCDDPVTEFLIYNLAPELQHQKDTIKRLSCLNARQLKCLEHFLEWCTKHEHWSSYCPEEIQRGLCFLRTLVSNAQQSAPGDASAHQT